jgi:hypothetical protein
MGEGMNDLKNEVAREYRKIAPRWRFRTAALYGSVLVLLLLLAHLTDQRRDEVAGLQKSWKDSVAERRQ